MGRPFAVFTTAVKSMILWANRLGGMTNYVHIPGISVRFNALRLLARNSLQGGKERQSEVFRVMYLTPHFIDPQHHQFPGGYERKRN